MHTSFYCLTYQRQGGFGSTGKKIYWPTYVNDDRPEMDVYINNVPFKGLVNTGADGSIISQ